MTVYNEYYPIIAINGCVIVPDKNVRDHNIIGE